MPQAAAPLPWQVRSDMFAQLAAMEKAGLPAVQAFGLLKVPPKLQSRVTAVKRLLVRGAPLARAGLQGALFSDLEASLVEAATQAGSPAPVYIRLAAYYTQRAAQARAMKSRMALPALVMIVGLFTQQLPQLVAGSISLGAYLWHSIRPLLAIGLLYCLGTMIYRVGEGEESEWRVALDRVLMRLPLFGKMLVRRNVRDFFESLALLVEAGMPILDALPRATATIKLAPVRGQFEAMAPGIAAGATLTTMVEALPLVAGSAATALIGTGEASGSLPEMLFRFADMETAAIAHFNKQVADWLPRIVYAIIALWVAYGILTSGAFMPHVPDELR
jgi:general secretion pathway protein F